MQKAFPVQLSEMHCCEEVQAAVTAATSTAEGLEALPSCSWPLAQIWLWNSSYFWTATSKELSKEDKGRMHSKRRLTRPPVSSPCGMANSCREKNARLIFCCLKRIYFPLQASTLFRAVPKASSHEATTRVRRDCSQSTRRGLFFPCPQNGNTVHEILVAWDLPTAKSGEKNPAVSTPLNTEAILDWAGSQLSGEWIGESQEELVKGLT